jgi:hypothetical protein
MQAAALVLLFKTVTTLFLHAVGGYMRTGTGTEVEAHPETPRFFVTGACELLAKPYSPCLHKV